VTRHSADDAAQRAGVEPGYLVRLVDLGIIAREASGFSPGDVRRAMMAHSLEEAGIPLDGVAAAMRSGAISLAFLDAPAYERLSALSPETFRETSARTGIPLELLTLVRETIGLAQPSPDDRMREDEMAMVPALQMMVSAGFRPISIERLLRVEGDGTRRIAETEAAIWDADVVAPAMAAGMSQGEAVHPELADRLGPLAEQAILATYRAQQARAWTANVIEGFETLLAQAGLHSRLERLGAARRKARQVARRRGDVPLPRPGARRTRRSRDGGRAGRHGPPARPRRPPCRTCAVPGG
jgi:hypothetical protein